MIYTPKTFEFHETRETLPFRRFDPRAIIKGYAARYPACYRFTLGFEGGYVNDPDDPGGCTNRGITIGTLQDWRDDPGVTCEDVKNLSEIETAMIYALNYWSPVWGNDLPVGLNLQVWDFGVNAGPSRSISTLQKCLPTSVDGIMGPNTVAAAWEADFDNVMLQFHEERQAYYASLSTFDKYGDGWTRRNDDCYETGLNLAAQDIDLPDLPEVDDAIELRVASLESDVDRLIAWAAAYGAAT